MTVFRWAPLLAIYICIASLPANAQVSNGDPPSRAPLELLFHADLMGDFAVPGCGGSAAEPADYASLVRVIATAREQAAAPPVVLLGGNTLAPGLFARGLLARDGDEGARTLAQLIRLGGYDAVALGPHDLGLARDRLMRFVQTAAKTGIPFVATNLSCDVHQQAFCAFVKRELVIERGGQRIGILATISPLVEPSIARPLLNGLAFEPPMQAIASALARLRKSGELDKVVLMTQMPRTKMARSELEELARALGPMVDVILAGGLALDDEQGALRLIRQDGSPVIVGSTTGTASLARVDLLGASQPPTVATIETRDASADPPTADLLSPHLKQYCERYGDSVAPAAIDGALTRQSFTKYVLSIMRKDANAEIALINRGFIKAQPFPIRGHLQRADLYRAIPYHAAVGVVRLQGADLERLLVPALPNPELVALGVEGAAGKVLVNGRPLDKARAYRIATIEFVASGGDDIFDEKALPFSPLATMPDLRQTVEGFLRTQTASEDDDPDVDADHDFGAAAVRRMLTVWLSDLTLDLSNTIIAGTRAVMPTAGYDAPQLTRAEQSSAKGQLTSVVQLRSLRQTTDFRFNGLYGYTRNQPQGQPKVGAEIADLLQFSVLNSYRGLRDVSLKAPRAAVPDPYARVLFESEFTKPSERAFHHGELTASFGAQFTPVPKLRVRGGPGVRKQLVADGDDGKTLALLEAGAIVDPLALPLAQGVSARLEGLVDYVFVDPTGLAQHQLKTTARLSVPLVPRLFFTLGADVYASRAEGKGWASAVDTLVGLRAHFDAAHQNL